MNKRLARDLNTAIKRKDQYLDEVNTLYKQIQLQLEQIHNLTQQLEVSMATCHEQRELMNDMIFPGIDDIRMDPEVQHALDNLI
jgi:hypothetical protein